MHHPRIKLTVAVGELDEKEFLFDEPSQCVIGRAFDCDIQIPADNEHGFVSRHHCLLDIHPPIVRVRDLGSLNGTYVNGRVIGQRRPGMPLEFAFRPSGTLMLDDGDELRIGDTIFRVGIFADTDEFQVLNRGA
jgi:eukaryotic-like serine/threonine-protein kinase